MEGTPDGLIVGVTVVGAHEGLIVGTCVGAREGLFETGTALGFLLDGLEVEVGIIVGTVVAIDGGVVGKTVGSSVLDL